MGSSLWTSLLLLALVINAEPTRLGLIALMLTRSRPVRFLVLFLGSGLSLNLSAGFVVLFLLNHTAIAPIQRQPYWVQSSLGVAFVLIGIVVLIKPFAGAYTRIVRRFKPFSAGEFRAFPVLAGTLLGLPSLEFLALLGLISHSGAEPLEQVAALLAFQAAANLVILIPVVGVVLRPSETKAAVKAFAEWISPWRRQYIGALAMLLGLLLVVTGI
jgi:hypothetical protein